MSSNDAVVERIAKRVMQRLSSPKIELEASGRHVHLTRESVDILYGKGYRLTAKAPLSQPGQFVCEERIQVVGAKGKFPSVVILGPERPETQLEISATDAQVLGIEAPVRLSGNIEGTPGVLLEGPKGKLAIPYGVIIALRHIHATPGYARLYGLSDNQRVSVQVESERPLTFHGVILRVSPQYDNYFHIDYDEANACGFYKGMMGTILP